jgi:hypothetical protein
MPGAGSRDEGGDDAANSSDMDMVNTPTISHRKIPKTSLKNQVDELLVKDRRHRQIQDILVNLQLLCYNQRIQVRIFYLMRIQL